MRKIEKVGENGLVVSTTLVFETEQERVIYFAEKKREEVARHYEALRDEEVQHYNRLRDLHQQESDSLLENEIK